MNPWVPIAALGALAGGSAIVSVAAGRMIGPRGYNQARLDAYACGIEPARPVADARFPVRCYVTAMLFIVLDVEIVLPHPWAVGFDSFGMRGLVEMTLFVISVFAVYACVETRWARMGLTRTRGLGGR